MQQEPQRLSLSEGGDLYQQGPVDLLTDREYWVVLFLLVLGFLLIWLGMFGRVGPFLGAMISPGGMEDSGSAAGDLFKGLGL